jgi:HEAT repeat protein
MPRASLIRVRESAVLAAIAFLTVSAPCVRAQEATKAAPGAAAPGGPPPEANVPPPVADPNPHRFAKDPRNLERWTPLELWDAVDYLMRVGEPDQAATFLAAFLARRPDDATLLEVRDRYGVGSILRLQDSPATRARARPLLNLLAEASRREATNPSRLRRLANALAATPQEQDYAVERLREARALAVPPLIRVLADKGLSAEARARVVAGMGRLDRSAVPPLLAALDAPDPVVAAGAAEALGHIGDPRAVPFLTHPAAQADAPAPLHDAARAAIARLTRRPWEAQPVPPARILAEEAKRYLEHAVAFPEGPFEAWAWQGDAPLARRMTPDQAEQELGLRFARQAAAVDPNDPGAREVLAAWSLRAALRAAGDDPNAAGEAAKAAGPGALVDVLRSAIARNDSELGVAAVRALAGQADEAALVAQGEHHPLVEALGAPDRRIRFAAARALVELEPRRPFAGSSRVVPTLLPFAAEGPAPRAVVADGNGGRANITGSVLHSLGYDVMTAPDGEQAFRLAAETADVEAILIQPDALLGSWSALDLLTNLRADARTAALPAFLLLPEDLARIQARAQQLSVVHYESEDNDTPDRANPLSFTTSPRQARIIGLLTGPDDRGDVYYIGRLVAGDAILAAVTMPPYSRLRPADVTLTIERRDEGTGAVSAVAQRNGVLTYTTTAGGVYYVRVQAPARRRGHLARYVLHVALADLEPPAVGTALRQRLDALASRFSGVAVLTAPGDPAILARQLARERDRMGARPLGDAERDALEKEASALLARIAARPDSPFAADVAGAGTALAETLSDRPAALVDLPSVAAQRTLADAVFDAARGIEARREAAEALVRSIRRFGPLLTAEQESQIAASQATEPDPALQAALTRIVDALKRRPAPAAPPAVPPPAPAPAPAPGGSPR